VDADRAQQLLEHARRETEAALARLHGGVPGEDRDPDEDSAGQADGLTERGTDKAIEESLRLRLEAIEAAEQRLRDGAYGRSTRSGEPIPDGRLEVEPWAELTVQEASRS
jgi:DnaK suppressor protein